MARKSAFFEQALSSLGKNGYRQLKSMIPINNAFLLQEDKKILSFCSFDYLGLAEHPEVKRSAIKALLQHGVNTPFSLQDYSFSYQEHLLYKLRKLFRRDAALLFSSRTQTNIHTLSTLGHHNCAIFLDELCHPSLSQGAYASEANVQYYSHNDLKKLEELLDQCPQPSKIIVTESINSLTGDLSDLPTFISLATQFDALLYVDDAHSFGIAGNSGLGLCAQLEAEIDLISGSFTKACGAYGGYLICSQILYDYLLNFAPEKTSYFLSPPMIGAIDAALDLIPQMEGERKQLEQRSHWLRGALREMGFTISKSNTPLISLCFNKEKEIDSLRQHLKHEQILVGPASFSSKNRLFPRLNLSLNICHMPDHLAQLVDAIKTWQQIKIASHQLATT